ncbi:MAG: hypothetical protein NUV52_00735 [Candidatus Roizmanbacteria bacterium]|nr:hypothetical protein [Candidatus Roizmanbacteria bacterium]
MSDIPFGAALGVVSPDNASGFIAEKNVYGIFEAHTPSSNDDVVELVHEIRAALAYLEFPTFDDFESFLATHTRTYSDEELSYVCCYVSSDDGIWIVTKRGAALLKRGNKLYTIAQGTQKKEGLLQEGDMVYISTTSLLPHLSIITPILSEKKAAKDIAETIQQTIHEVTASGGCLLFPYQPPHNVPLEEATPPEETFVSPRPRAALPKQTIMRIGGILIILGVIGFSAWFITGRIVAQQNKQVRETIMETQAKLEQVQDSLTQGTPEESAAGLKEVEQTITTLRKKKVSVDNAKALNALNDKFELVQSSVGSMDVTDDEPFFDMRLVSNQAQASSFTLINDTLVISDQKNNKLYAVSVTDKSVEQFSPAKDTKPTLVTQTSNGNLVYFDKAKGIYQSQTTGSFAVIVKTQKQWKNPIALTSYGTNLYLLDKGADELFKYTPIEGGYSDSLSYFASGSAMDLSDAKSVVIDFSVYLLTDAELLKFKAGARESFSLADSISPSSITSLYTDEDSSYLYGLDAARSRIIVLDKDGTLLQSIFNPKLKEAKSFGVIQDKQIVFLYENSVLSLDNSQ